MTHESDRDFFFVTVFVFTGIECEHVVVRTVRAAYQTNHFVPFFFSHLKCIFIVYFILVFYNLMGRWQSMKLYVCICVFRIRFSIQNSHITNQSMRIDKHLSEIPKMWRIRKDCFTDNGMKWKNCCQRKWWAQEMIGNEIRLHFVWNRRCMGCMVGWWCQSIGEWRISSRWNLNPITLRF